MSIIGTQGFIFSGITRTNNIKEEQNQTIEKQTNKPAVSEGYNKSLKAIYNLYEDHSFTPLKGTPEVSASPEMMEAISKLPQETQEKVNACIYEVENLKNSALPLDKATFFKGRVDVTKFNKDDIIDADITYSPKNGKAKNAEIALTKDNGRETIARHEFDQIAEGNDPFSSKIVKENYKVYDGATNLTREVDFDCKTGKLSYKEYKGEKDDRYHGGHHTINSGNIDGDTGTDIKGEYNPLTGKITGNNIPENGTIKVRTPGGDIRRVDAYHERMRYAEYLSSQK